MKTLTCDDSSIVTFDLTTFLLMVKTNDTKRFVCISHSYVLKLGLGCVSKFELKFIHVKHSVSVCSFVQYRYPTKGRYKTIAATGILVETFSKYTNPKCQKISKAG